MIKNLTVEKVSDSFRSDKYLYLYRKIYLYFQKNFKNYL